MDETEINGDRAESVELNPSIDAARMERDTRRSETEKSKKKGT